MCGIPLDRTRRDLVVTKTILRGNRRCVVVILVRRRAPVNRQATESHALVYASASDVADGLSNASVVGVAVPGLGEVEAEIDALHRHHLALPRVVRVRLEAVVERRSALVAVEDVGLAHVALEHDSAFEVLAPRVEVLAVSCHHYVVFQSRVVALETCDAVLGAGGGNYRVKLSHP